MISKQLNRKSIVIGNTTIPYMPIINDIVAFIDKHLKNFPTFIQGKTSRTTNETWLNQELVTFFNHCTIQECLNTGTAQPYRFLFGKDDEVQGLKTKPDIGVTLSKNAYTSERSIFQIECKRLPIPNISKQRSEREYVHGYKLDGGIERYKFNRHGSHLSYSALVGYIQDGEPADKWHKKITGWIADLIGDSRSNLYWQDSDHLKHHKKISNTLNKYEGKHARENAEYIHLFHYLLRMG